VSCYDQTAGKMFSLFEGFLERVALFCLWHWLLYRIFYW